MKKVKFRSVGECMGELQLAKDGLFSLGFGGDTLNTTWYIRALSSSETVEVEYVTVVGRDPLSRQMLHFLNDNAIGTNFVRTVVDRNIGLYHISLSGAERSFTYWRENSAAKLLTEDPRYFSRALANSDFIYFSAITLAILSPEHRNVLFDQLRQLKGAGATIAFDSNARPKLWSSEQEMKEATILGYQVATIALPTFADEQSMFGDTTIADCANRIVDYGVKEVVVKDGANASCSLVDGNLFDVKPQQVSNVIDTTAAGDSFNAGYLVGRMRKFDPRAAAKLGHQVASRVISHHGALVPMSNFSDLRVNLR
jgi:2-dehydro-3-deoxygluconokinase